MTATPQATIREIVAADFRTAAVFERRGLDFCCSAGRTIEQACRDAGADEAVVLRELAAVLEAPADGTPCYDTWDARALIAHIVGRHHDYVRQAIPPLLQHTKKIATVHGERHPELIHIAGLFQRVADEMTDHMVKEENILFPVIAALEQAVTAHQPAPFMPFGTVENPISVMEAEHRFVGDAMAEMRHLTDGFVPPGDACATYRVCLHELDAFERDLHEHVHLENNLLFPKAVTLESAGRSARASNSR
jgi:regulator of cell morphogenesis and NO signaling